MRANPALDANDTSSKRKPVNPSTDAREQNGVRLLCCGLSPLICGTASIPRVRIAPTVKPHHSPSSKTCFGQGVASYRAERAIHSENTKLARRHGFTIIELLVALTLSALLITATLGVVGNMSRDLDRLKKVHHKPAWQVNLERQLQHDLANARRYELKPGKLTLTGHGATASHTSTLTLCPSLIEYELVTVDSDAWLIRSVAEIGKAPYQRNLVCQGITNLQKVNKDATLTDSAAGDMSSGMELRLIHTDSEPITIRSLR